MKATEKTEEIYTQLPRFVSESEKIEYINERYLPAIVRNCSIQNQEFTFIITPARIRDENSGKERHYYPTEREELIENVLRRKLAVIENPNFDSEDLILYFTLSQLMEHLDISSNLRDEKRGFARLSVEILSDVKFELLHGSSQLYFRPIERLSVREIDGETYFRANFSQLFFNQTEQFDFCFIGKKCK